MSKERIIKANPEFRKKREPTPVRRSTRRYVLAGTGTGAGLLAGIAWLSRRETSPPAPPSSSQDRLDFARERYRPAPENTVAFSGGLIANYAYPEMKIQFATALELERAKAYFYPSGIYSNLIHITVLAPVLEEERDAVERTLGTKIELGSQLINRYNLSQRPVTGSYDTVIRVIPVLEVISNIYHTQDNFRANRGVDKATLGYNLSQEWLRTLSPKGGPRYSYAAVNGVIPGAHAIDILEVDQKLAKLANLK